MRTGYVTTFIPLQYAMMLVVEYVCSNGHRIKDHNETIPWDAKWMIWC